MVGSVESTFERDFPALFELGLTPRDVLAREELGHLSAGQLELLQSFHEEQVRALQSAQLRLARAQARAQAMEETLREATLASLVRRP